MEFEPGTFWTWVARSTIWATMLRLIGLVIGRICPIFRPWGISYCYEPVLYVSTSIWVLSTPNAGRNSGSSSALIIVELFKFCNAYLHHRHKKIELCLAARWTNPTILLKHILLHQFWNFPHQFIFSILTIEQCLILAAV